MKIAIVVQGRFHAFDLVRDLLRRGHDVTIFTNYPKWAVRRFGIVSDRVRSFWVHGLAARTADRMRRIITGLDSDPILNPLFGRWAADQLKRESWDVIHAWSGVSEEFLAAPDIKAGLKLIMRGSAHIRTQSQILGEEESRTGVRIDKPSEWIVAREEREYKLADRIVVLSTFARDSFLAEGVEPDKIRLVPLGADVQRFRPQREVIEARCKRIISGEPLRILYVGALMYRKGLHDISEIVRHTGQKFAFRFIGPISAEAKGICSQLRSQAEFIAKQPQLELPKWYAWGDVFLFPTIEDGYAVVLAQAHASGLPILTTPNCCGPDLIGASETGWILPIRSPEAFIDRLLWCDSHRAELADMVWRTFEGFHQRDWADVAADFEALCERELKCKAESVTASA